MRVYELSKKLGVPSKTLLEALDKEGIGVKSHMSALDDAALSLLQRLFGDDQKKVTKVPAQGDKKVMQVQQSKREQKTVSPKTSAKSAPVQKGKPSLTAQRVEEPPVLVLEPMTVSDIALRLHRSVNDVILTLLSWGLASAKNQVISEDTIKRLAEYYNVEIVKPSVSFGSEEDLCLEEGTGKLEERLPIVVVLGHVDHGKTTLLDFIRKTRVVSKEKGGITQHLGAYEAMTEHGNLVFLDTPGHEAFPKMRQRGVRVADIGVLVIAADDGIMPQTLEAIKVLKKMEVPIVVAINKIDKVDPSRIEVVKRQLAEQDLLPEEWGGQTVCIPISALKGNGVNQLLEMIALQAQLLELRASREGKARGFVLESNLERGRGPVATIILQHGTLSVGDHFTCGQTTGRVSSIKDSYGKILQHAGPSIPILVAGFDELPGVGDRLQGVSKEEFRKQRQRKGEIGAVVRVAREGAINLIVKADTNSSIEALIDAINTLSKKEDIGFNVLHAGVGDISESDVELAYNTGSSLIGLHVKAETNALTLAQRRGISIKLYDIIYKLLEALQERAYKAKPVETVRTKIGEAIVRRVFDIQGVGVIAGSYVQDGRFSKDGYVVGWRGRQKIGEGKIISLQREKKTVKEVHAGYECGFVVDGITDWQVDDRVECFIDIPKSS